MGLLNQSFTPPATLASQSDGGCFRFKILYTTTVSLGRSNQNKKTCVWMQSRIHTSFLFCDYLFFPTFRRETMSRFEYFFGRRDFCPLPVGLP